MSSYRQQLGFLALVATLSLPCAAQTSPTPKPHARGARTGASRKASAPKPAVQEEPLLVVQQPPTPPPPSRPYELTPAPPQVTFSGGQLTISAPNSTLADILTAVRSRIGTKVDFPSSAAQERVALQLGPGNPRDVLSQLLHGSPFDYILLGSEQDPTAVTQIMLTRRQGSATTVAAENVPTRAPNQPYPPEEDGDNDLPTTQPAPPQPGHPQPPQ